MIALSGTTTGTIDSVGVRRGRRGTSAPKIAFSYTVRGCHYASDQFAPGVFARGTWSGGGRVAGEYHVGQTVAVHYDPRRPQDACLAYGWHSWTIGLPLFVIGLGLQGWGSRRGGRRGDVAQVVGWTMVPLGVAGFVLIRDVLRPSDLPTAAAIGAGIFAVQLLYRMLKGWPR